jgi:hypothetical protein
VNNELVITPETPIPAHLVNEIQPKLAYIDEAVLAASVSPTGDKVTLTIGGGTEGGQFAEIERKTHQVISKVVENDFKPRIKVLEDYLGRATPFQDDPMAELLESGEIRQEQTGVYAFGPLLTGLIDFFESQFLQLADHFNARPYRFPTLIPASDLERVNYFRAFPHSLSFATHLRSDLDVIDEFSQHACTDEHGLNTGMDSFARIQTLLSPAVCYHLYFMLADQPLPNGALCATAVSNCFRYESSNLQSLERLWNFTMREVIFVGGKDFVLNNREEARQIMEEKFARIGLAYKVETANDPFFIGEFKQAVFQSAFQLKYEIRARLPFKDSTLAVGSYNYHQDFFGRHLNITLPDGSPAQTGCVAFGLERIAYAFLCQYGLDRSNWPPFVRKGV